MYISDPKHKVNHKPLSPASTQRGRQSRLLQKQYQPMQVLPKYTRKRFLSASELLFCCRSWRYQGSTLASWDAASGQPTPLLGL